MNRTVAQAPAFGYVWRNSRGRNLQLAAAHTSVIPGHGPPGTRAQLAEYHDMLVAIRDRVAGLERQGLSLNQVIAAKPTASFDATYGQGIIDAALFTARNRVVTHLNLYRWLTFNLLVTNTDNHLKNLSFIVSAAGIELAPSYDLWSTGAYHARAFANERANWPAVDLAIGLPCANTLGAVTRDSILRAGEALGLPKRLGERELDRLLNGLPPLIAALEQRIERENADVPDSVRVFLAGETRLLATVRHIVVKDMVQRLEAA